MRARRSGESTLCSRLASSAVKARLGRGCAECCTRPSASTRRADAPPAAGWALVAALTPTDSSAADAQRIDALARAAASGNPFSAHAHELQARARLLLGPYWTYDRPIEVGWTWGTALAVRREAVERAGPPDPSFVMYGEDLEWCLRLRAHGYSVWHCPDATAVHVGQGSAHQRWDAAARTRLVEEACERALLQHRGAAWLACLRALRFGTLLLEGAAGALRGRRLAPPLAAALDRYWRDL